MKRVLVSIALLSVGGALHAQSIGEKTGVNALIGVSPPDADFVKEAALGDMFETVSSELAAIRGSQAARAFAAKMNEDHQKSSSELSLTVKSHIDQTPLPSQLDDAHQSKLETLKKLEGDDFSNQYFRDQHIAHSDAVALFERYDKGGSNEGLKSFVRQTLPTLKMHLEMLNRLAK